jgi:hypothetical protein
MGAIEPKETVEPTQTTQYQFIPVVEMEEFFKT